MAVIAGQPGVTSLTNPLATTDQLETWRSQLGDLEHSIRFAACNMLQAAGVLLCLRQEIVAQSIVILCRVWIGGDDTDHVNSDAKDVASAALYLVAKASAHPVSPRQLLTVMTYLDAVRPDYGSAVRTEVGTNLHWGLSEEMYEIARNSLYKCEGLILRKLGFQIHVALPYNICINYLQTLEVFDTADGPRVAKRAFSYLNSALLSPQLLYLTHQPNALATAAIYVAARETGVSLPEVEWWEVFDVDREELGFLVLALLSTAAFADDESERSTRRNVSLAA